MPAVFKVFSRVWPLVLAFAAVAIAYLLSAGSLLEQQQQFDRIHLAEFFEAGSYDNDLLLDTYYISHNTIQPQLVNVDLLGLKRDRLAYRARSGDEVVAIAVPASAEDGFNGTIDLLVSIDMYGRIGAAKVIEDLVTSYLPATGLFKSGAHCWPSTEETRCGYRGWFYRAVIFGGGSYCHVISLIR